MEIKTICCNKEMKKVNVYNDIINTIYNDIETTRFFCVYCGKFIDINTYTLNDEELINMLENEEEEYKDTKIYKELIKD